MFTSYRQAGREKKAKELSDQSYEETGIGKPKKKIKKSFIIEHRVKPAVFETWMDSDGYYRRIFNKKNDWKKYKAYSNKHSMIQAYEAITKRVDFFSINYEFRIKEQI